MKRSIYVFKNYFLEFFEKQDLKTQRKIEITMDLIRYEERIPANFFKHIRGTNGIYEIRISTSHRNIRIFCFFDKDDRIIIMNCIVKKSGKIRTGELKQAILIRRNYFMEQSNIDRK